MTPRDILTHFISWRFQAILWAICLWTVIIIDAHEWGLWATLSGAHAVDVFGVAGIFFAAANIGWTVIKTCIVFPDFANYLFWFEFWSL